MLLTLQEICAKALWVSGVRRQSLVHLGVFPNWQEVQHILVHQVRLLTHTHTHSIRRMAKPFFLHTKVITTCLI